MKQTPRLSFRCPQALFQTSAALFPLRTLFSRKPRQHRRGVGVLPGQNALRAEQESRGHHGILGTDLQSRQGELPGLLLSPRLQAGAKWIVQLWLGLRFNKVVPIFRVCFVCAVSWLAFCAVSWLAFCWLSCLRVYFTTKRGWVAPWLANLRASQSVLWGPCGKHHSKGSFLPHSFQGPFCIENLVFEKNDGKEWGINPWNHGG